MRFMLRLFLFALLPLVIALPALAFGFASGTPSVTLMARQETPQADVTVAIRGGAFHPATVNAKPGQTIAWVNQDDRDYSLASSSKSLPGFASNTLKPGAVWVYRVPSSTPAGSYSYACKLRPRAKGTVRIVTE